MAINSRRKIFSNFAALSVIQGTNFLIPIIIMPYLIRKIGADSFGIVSVAQVAMVYLGTITDYGFNLTATRRIVRHKEEPDTISRLFFTVLGSKMLITLFLFLLLLLLGFVVPASPALKLLYLLGFTYVWGQSATVGWFFQGVEKMQYITIATLISRAIFVALVFIFIRQKDDHIFFLFFLGIGNVIAGLFSIYLAIRMYKLRFVRPLWSDLIFELKDGWQIMASNLSISTYMYMNVFILRLFTNDLIVGYYSIAERIFFGVRQILGIFSQAIYPRICQLVHDGKKQTRSFFKDIYLPFLLLTIAGCCTCFIFAPRIIHFMLGDHSAISVLLFRILAFVPAIVCLNIPAYQILLAFNKKRSYLLILSLGTVLNIVANVLLVNRWEAVGTTISIIITEVFITVGLNIALFKNDLGDFIKPKSI
ncbi:flippase [Paraflavitalea soli]|uniref:Flippase n=1 Tax=Paraflavitalea soli TaxID=2315862 RepID=A0A3B7MTN6_9BACT|nr:flippase [Paraflavitalea soli]AXY77478.1 flippase [Paraflavitalea soli]